MAKSKKNQIKAKRAAKQEAKFFKYAILITVAVLVLMFVIFLINNR